MIIAIELPQSFMINTETMFLKMFLNKQNARD